MKSTLRVPLNTDADRTARLVALQRGFAALCNALMPVVEGSGIWNRVALHHLAYRDLRRRFPAMGSQMVCNAIYSVSRTCRLLYQNPKSPFHLARPGDAAFPRVRFADTSPVYFDRHTLSIRDGRLSMFTLDGRMHFDLTLRPENERALRTQRLREIVLMRRDDGIFELSFRLGDDAPAAVQPPRAAVPAPATSAAAPKSLKPSGPTRPSRPTGAAGAPDTPVPGPAANALNPPNVLIPDYLLLEETP